MSSLRPLPLSVPLNIKKQRLSSIIKIPVKDVSIPFITGSSGSSSKQPRRSLFIQITGPPSSGKSHLLYEICKAVVPENLGLIEADISRQNKPSRMFIDVDSAPDILDVVIVYDVDLRWGNKENPKSGSGWFSMRKIIHNAIVVKLGSTILDEDQYIQNCLDRIIIVTSIDSISSLSGHIDSLAPFLLDYKSPSLSSYRLVSIMVDSITPFYWQSRAERNLNQDFSLLLNALKKAQSIYECAIIVTCLDGVSNNVYGFRDKSRRLTNTTSPDSKENKSNTALSHYSYLPQKWNHTLDYLVIINDPDEISVTDNEQIIVKSFKTATQRWDRIDFVITQDGLQSISH